MWYTLAEVSFVLNIGCTDVCRLCLAVRPSVGQGDDDDDDDDE